jgi:hypothetical protein
MLPGKSLPRFVGGGVGDRPRLSGAADAAPFPDEAPLPEEIGLHVKPVKPAHVPRGIGAVQKDRAHAFSLEIVAALTL